MVLLKLPKWGCIASYRGAQIFEAIGLNQDLIDTYFTKTASRVEGIGLSGISRDIKTRHLKAYAKRDDNRNEALDPGGIYQWRSIGKHCLTL